jgi:Tfp pilus assembly protein PilZ
VGEEEMTQDHKSNSETRELWTFETGTRVSKPDAIPVDFAFGKTGTVIRERIEGVPCLGVVWDGSRLAFEYPGESRFIEVSEAGDC